MLYSLYERSKTWSELIFEFQINPKSLRDHLYFLIESGLVRKKKDVGFELTDAATGFIETSLEELISTAEKAAEIAR